MRKLYHLLIIPFLVDYIYAQDLQIAQNSPLHVRLGASLTRLTCYATLGMTAEGFQWYDTKQVPVTSSSSSDHMYVRNFAGDAVRGPGVILRISNFQASDGGRYTCRATVNGQEQETFIDIEYFHDITFNNCDSPQYIVQGLDQNVTCQADAGGVFLETFWDFNGTSIVAVEDEDGDSHYVNSNKGYLIIRNVTKADAGTYLYFAEPDENTDLMPKTKKINVVVRVKPVMRSLTSDDNPVIKGGEAKLFCVANGEPDPQYFWYKETVSIPLGQNGGTGRISSYVDGKNGILHIRDVVKEDAGTYICVATNEAGSTQATLKLVVHIPPVISPISNASGAEGSPLEIPCRASGNPTPVITWGRVDGTSILDSPYISFPVTDIPNPDDPSASETEVRMKFSELQPEFAGAYKCMAKNNAGTVEEVVSLDVKYGPIFVVEPGQNIFYNWETNPDGHLLCTVQANPVPIFSWHKGGLELTDADPAYKILSVTNDEPRHYTSKLKVILTPANQESVIGEYTCKSQNIIGRSEQTLQMALAGPPGPPVASIDQNSATVVVLGILPPSGSGPPIKSYRATIRKESDHDGANAKSAESKAEDRDWTDDRPIPRTYIRLENLTASTPYVISVVAKNDVGYGEERIIQHTTEKYSVPDSVEVYYDLNNLMPTSILVFWNEPLKGGLDIGSYTVKYRRVNVKNTTSLQGQYEEDTSKRTGDDWHDITQIPYSRHRQRIDNLRPGSYYAVAVIAYNSLGGSIPIPKVFMTKEASVAPGASTAVGTTPTAEKSKTDVKEDNTGDSGGLSTGAIIGIVIAIFILLFIIVDITCYFKNNCGLLMTIREKVGGGRTQDGYSPTKGDDVETLPNKDQLTEDVTAAEEGKAAEPDDVDEKKEPLLSGEQTVDTVDECETKDESKEMEPEDKAKEKEPEAADAPEEPAQEATEATEEEPANKPE